MINSDYHVFKSDVLKSTVPLLQGIVEYIGEGRGKQIRPALVFAVAKSLGFSEESVYKGALLVELLHTASLIHDDVVDESYKRRGRDSVNKLWDNKAAVLSGDYLFAKCLRVCANMGDIKYVKELAWCTEMITQGEMMQLEKSKSLDITEEQYFDIIGMKTAALFVTAARFGAMCAEEKDIENAGKFGNIVGSVFQIRDDLLDMDTSGISGKPYGGDIKEKKITLPLIHTIRNAEPKDQAYIMDILRKDVIADEDVLNIIAIANKTGSNEYVESVIEGLVKKGLELTNDDGMRQLLHNAAKRDK